VPPQKLERLTTAYAVGTDGGLEAADDPARSAWAKPPLFPSGGGGLISTAADYLAFCRMLLDGGGNILSRAAVREMMTDQLTQAQKDASPFYPGFWTRRGWGYGGEVTTTFRGNRRQYGWTGGFGTTFFIEPGAQGAAILLTQRQMTSPVPLPIARDVAKFATEAIAGR
jgi:CubicO group peptidase (beta-lactamase class C family)